MIGVVARRVHHDLRGVGERVDRAAIDTQLKTDFIVTLGTGFNRGAGFSPQLGEAASASCRSSSTRPACASDSRGINGKPIR